MLDAAARSSWQTSSLESRGGMSFKAKMFSSFGMTRRQLPRVTALERKHIKKIECAVFLFVFAAHRMCMKFLRLSGVEKKLAYFYIMM